MFIKQADVETTTPGDGLGDIATAMEIPGQLELGIEQVGMLREDRPEQRQHGFVAEYQGPERFVNHYLRAQQHVDQSWGMAGGGAGAQVCPGVILLALCAKLVQRRLPGPGFPDIADRYTLGVDYLTLIVPAQAGHAPDDPAAQAGLFSGGANVLGVVGLLIVFVLHDMQHAVHAAGGPGRDQFRSQVRAGILALGHTEVPRPLALHPAGLHIAGG